MRSAASKTIEVTPTDKRGSDDRFVYSTLAAASLLYCLPLFLHLDHYGRADWDQFTTRYETPRVALLRDGQLPFWNPYVNGGTILLAHPHCPAASPWYLLVLAVGAPLGLRIQVVLFVFLGATGMARLLREWNVATAGRLVGGVILMMSAHFALHIAEGHLEWCVLGLMPWLVLWLQKAGRGGHAIFVAGLLFASVLLFGSVYIVAVYVPFLTAWRLLESARLRSLRPLLAWGGVLLLTVLLSAVKLLPQLEFTSRHPREVAAEGISPDGLTHVFLDPRQAFLYQATRDVIIPPTLSFAKTVPNDTSVPLTLQLMDHGFKEAWHEYGCYVTWPGLVLALVGIFVSVRKHWPLYLAGLAALLTSLGTGAPMDLWSLLHQLPLYSSLHVPSRFLAAVVLVLAIAAGEGAGWFWRLMQHRSRPTLASLVTYSLAAAVYLELLVMGWKLFGDIFVCDPHASGAAGLRIYPHEDFANRFQESWFYYPVMTSCLYPRLMGNTGVLQGYENIAVPQGGVKTVRDPDYRGESYLLSGRGAFEVLQWTMSRIVCRVEIGAPDAVMLNQNFHQGWRADIEGQTERRDVEAERGPDGLVAVPVRPGDTGVEVYYRPPGFVPGAWSSLLTLIGSFAVFLVQRRRRSVQGDARETE